MPLNCHRCGRFVGKGGDPDAFYDDYWGTWEVGYPRCARCVQDDLLSVQNGPMYVIGVGPKPLGEE